IFRHCRTAVLNREDPWVRDMATEVQRRVSFGLDAPKSGDYGVLGAGDDEWLARGEEKLMPASGMRLKGRHNLANALAALALGGAAGWAVPAMLAAVEGFRGLPHRMEFVGRSHDVTYYDDSKGTNVGATLAAVQGVTRPLVLIAGGDGKGQDFAPLAAALQ